jgi:hypothetical protein
MGGPPDASGTAARSNLTAPASPVLPADELVSVPSLSDCDPVVDVLSVPSDVPDIPVSPPESRS